MRANTDSVENLAIAFFDRNPDEELTVRDAMVKFDASQTMACQVLNGLVDRGILRASRRKQPTNQVIKVYGRDVA